ncbi:Soluble epoxide hydrolase [Pseudocercospora fuligena]|uniref:Soluble epoxide hydrolase n=1 Tax=Pseudocercospora fuligena TaxID=685502 RepID=A0A8H6VHC4_9PEZI|nr:Soluble epoxide hydrolase [Pseudocercospora fuligena]
MPSSRPVDESTWRHAQASITAPSSSAIVANASPYTFRLHYVDAAPSTNSAPAKRTILLIHGFPQTSLQWRRVIPHLTSAGCRVIVPDYRGAGNSQAPPSNAGTAGGVGGGYTKRVMADDLHTLLHSVLKIQGKVHIVGHDIGAMIAHAEFYYKVVTEQPQNVWHFTFHNVQDDLPERLVTGHERTYIRHFFDRLMVNPWAIAPGGEEEDAYVLASSRPGAMRAAFDAYRAFEVDGQENLALLKERGKGQVPVSTLAEDGSFNRQQNREQIAEFHKYVEADIVSNSGHYIPDENPDELAEKIVAWASKIDGE